uniref:WGS project CAEQ00000000 data, annotated contig 1319 n=1 Tax=Trypanosoma congolense (strain IL3000) TaxID=1068625 RepID=F9W5E9_TRYCI|nr:unnamed protein product [Trypanosoma congolense IL3000]
MGAAAATFSGGNGIGSASSSGGIRVQYGSTGEREERSASGKRSVNNIWGSVGVVDPERSLGSVRKWLSHLCQTLVEEVSATDRWFAERQLISFDCSHSLEEVIPMPSPSAPSRVGFGAPQTQAAPPQPFRKADALMEERRKIASQGQNVQNCDVTMHLDQRLQLETKLDTNTTFPPATPTSVTEQHAQRSYVLERIRTFASQTSLASYHHSRGDKHSWRNGFPTDAHLLIHIVRTCVPGFSDYVKFPHQSSNSQHDVTLVVGDMGEPYFYVRYRSGCTDETFSTRTGPNSLFEALVLFAAVLRTRHRGSYGGIGGLLDLTLSGLLNV